MNHLSIVKSGLLPVLANFLSAALSFVLTISLARNLSPAEFGIMSAWLSFAAIITLFMNLGSIQFIFNHIVINKVNDTSECDHLVGSALSNSLVVFVIFEMISIITNSSYLAATAFLSFGIYVTQLESNLYRARDQVYKNLSCIVTNRLVIVLASIISVLFLPYAISSLFVWAASSVLNSFKFILKNFSFAVGSNLQILSQIPFLFLIELTSVVYIRSNYLIFDYYNIPYESVASYSAAYKIVEACVFLILPIANSLLIEFSKTTNFENYSKFVTNAIRIALLMGCLIAVIFYEYADSMIILLFGDKYIAASSYLLYFGVYFIFYLPKIPLIQHNYIFNKARLIFFISFISMLVFLVINILCINRFGVMSSVFAFVASEFLSLGMFLYCYLINKRKAFL